MEILIKKTKKALKTLGWSILVVMLLLVGFHIWFVYHSEKVIERLIAWRSNGKLRATIKKFSIDYFNNNAEIKELSIFNTDTVSRGTAYRFTTQQLHFNIRSKWELVFHKKLLVDSLIFSYPNITITRKAHPDSVGKKLPLAEELGNVYKAINNSLAVLNLERFEINNGKVMVKDAGAIGKTRFELNRIFLAIDHLKMDSANRKNKHSFAFSDRVLLHILQQTVKLPDDKSSIFFKDLLIDSKLGIIEFTDPAIKIYPPAGLKNSFAASATQLNITGLDFNTLYNQPLIKIDSVFMKNPQGDLQFYRKDKKVNNKKQMPLDDALRNLPVAVNISHVVVQNGTVTVALHQAGKKTTFDTKNDNLSIVGITLNDTSSRVLNIQGFNYTVKNYVGYTPDSIYRYRFDSLQFIDNKIILYNFNITTIKKIQSILIRNYTVPKFEITDMDWPSFMFNNHFKAKKAMLIDAVFKIEKNSDIKNVVQKSNKKSIYQTLSVMDNLFDLDELKVVNGEFNAKQGEDLSLHIGNLNWDINANELTEAKTFKQLIKSVKQLYFDTATATNAAVTIHCSKSNFNNHDKSLLFTHVLMNANNQSVIASLNAVSVNDFSFDNKELDVKEIRWNDGVINIDGRNMDGDKLKSINKNKYAFALNNISGNNTAFFFENEHVKAQVNLKHLTVASLSKYLDNPVQLNKLFVDGENAIVNLPDAQLLFEAITINDEEKSMLRNVSFIRKTKTDTAVVQLPLASFIPFINKSILTNSIVIDSVEVREPQIFLTATRHENNSEAIAKPIKLPAVRINGIHINDAAFHLTFADEINKSIVDSKKLSLHVHDIVTNADNSMLFNQIDLAANTISLNRNGDNLFSINGNVNAIANKFLLNASTKYWQLQLNKFAADNFNYLIKEEVSSAKSLSINAMQVQNIIASNIDMEEGLPWLINKSSAFISLGLMHWQTSKINLQLKSFLFDANKKQLIVDSILIDPGQAQKEFVDNLVYRKAYINASVGKMKFEGINYRDDLIHISHITSNDAYLNVFSDNLKKAKPQTIRPLPIESLKGIKLPLQIDTLQLNNMAVHYTETNALTKKTGTIIFNSISGNLFNIYTKPTKTTDSLRLKVDAYFMDKLPVHFAIQSAYNDLLNGFAVQLSVGQGNAKLLNTVLEPFILLRAKSGFIDTMHMSAVANNNTANGNMRLYYHGLNAELLDSGSVAHPSFKTRFFSFLANSFAIRNNNNKRITNFNFAHTPTKSAVNYLLKMVVEGAAGNVMPQASKILIRKQLKKEAKRQGTIVQEDK